MCICTISELHGFWHYPDNNWVLFLPELVVCFTAGSYFWLSGDISFFPPLILFILFGGAPESNNITYVVAFICRIMFTCVISTCNFYFFLNFPLIYGNMVGSLMGSLPEMISSLGLLWFLYCFKCFRDALIYTFDASNLKAKETLFLVKVCTWLDSYGRLRWKSIDSNLQLDCRISGKSLAWLLCKLRALIYPVIWKCIWWRAKQVP